MWKVLVLVTAMLIGALPARAEEAAEPAASVQNDLAMIIKKLHEPDARIIVMRDGTIHRLSTAMGWRFIFSEETRILNHCHFMSVLGPGGHEVLRGARVIGALDDDYAHFAVQYDLQCVKVGEDQLTTVLMGVAVAALFLL